MGENRSPEIGKAQGSLKKNCQKEKEIMKDPVQIYLAAVSSDGDKEKEVQAAKDIAKSITHLFIRYSHIDIKDNMVTLTLRESLKT